MPPATRPIRAYSAAKVAATPRRVIPSVLSSATSRPRREEPALIVPARMAMLATTVKPPRKRMPRLIRCSTLSTFSRISRMRSRVTLG